MKKYYNSPEFEIEKFVANMYIATSNEDFDNVIDWDSSGNFEEEM